MSNTISAGLKDLEIRVDELQERVEKLWRQMIPFQSEGEKRVLAAAQAIGLRSFKMKRVPEGYYTWSLDKRRESLNAPTVHHLCKSIIVENTLCSQNDCSDPLNSKFYCVIIQYTTRLMGHKLFHFVRSLKNYSVAKKYYHFNLAKESDSDYLTNYEHNGVCPLGMREKIPIILSKRILELNPDWMWLGGGDKNVKFGVLVREFLEVVKPFVADVTHEGFDYDSVNVEQSQLDDLNESKVPDRKSVV